MSNRKYKATAPAGYDPSKFDRPSVTVDIVALKPCKGDLQVLLIKRKNHPFKGFWAIPGGFIEMDESLEESAVREFQEEAGIKVSKRDLVQFFMAGDPQRDPRTRVISACFLSVLSEAKCSASAGDDAAEAQWFSLFRLPRLAFDHKMILKKAMQRLQDDLTLKKPYLRSLTEQLKQKELRTLKENLNK
jgi:8-oxo-dGTP diphosphatase